MPQWLGGSQGTAALPIDNDCELKIHDRTVVMLERLSFWAHQPFAPKLQNWCRLFSTLISAWSCYSQGTYYAPGRMSPGLLARLRRASRIPALMGDAFICPRMSPPCPNIV